MDEKRTKFHGVLFKTDPISFTTIDVESCLKENVLRFKLQDEIELLYPDGKWYTGQVISSGSKIFKFSLVFTTNNSFEKATACILHRLVLDTTIRFY